MAGLAGVMNSPMPGEQTMIRHQRTMHDVTLGSMASGFDPDEEEEAAYRPEGRQKDRVLRELSSQAIPSTRHTPDTNDNGKHLAPPTSISRPSSRSVNAAAAKDRENARLRQLGRELGADGSMNDSVDRSAQGVPGPATYIQIGNASTEADESEDQLTKSVVDISGVSPGWGGKDGDGYVNARPSSSAGRKKTEGSNGVPDLQEQGLKKQMEDFEKIRAENFEFRLILDQLRNQMDNLGDANTNHILHENMELKANKARLTQDLKRHAKLAKQAESALAAVIAERDTAEQRARDLSKMVKEQGAGGKAGDIDLLKRRIEELERLLAEAEEDADNLRREMEEGDAEEVQRLKDALDDAEKSEELWKAATEEREEQIDDLRQELAMAVDARDRAEDALGNGPSPEDQEQREKELKKLRERLEQHKADNDSLRNELEVTRTRLATRDDERKEHIQKIQLLSEELDSLSDEHARARRAAGRAEDADQLQAERDHAEAQLELSNQECEDLRITIEDLQSRISNHEQDLDRVADEWQAEVTIRDQRLDDALARLQTAEQELAEKDTDLHGTNKDLKATSDQIWELDQLNEQLKIDKQKLMGELVRADDQLAEAEQIEERLKSAVAELEADCEHLQGLVRQREDERDRQRTQVDELSQQLSDLEARHRQDNEAKRQALEDRDDSESELRRARSAKNDAEGLLRDVERDVERWKRQVHEKEEANARLSSDIESARKRLTQRDKDVQELQTALRSLEDDRRKIGDEHTSDRFGLELEIERVKRDLARSEEEAVEAGESLRRLESQLGERDSEIASLHTDIRDLEEKITSERQERLSLSDRLAAAQKAHKRSETEADTLRARLSDLERRLAHDQRELSSSHRNVDTSKREAQELLTAIYLRVAKMSGSDELDAPATPSAMKEKLLSRLRVISQAHSDFERKLKAVESALDQKFSGLQRELEAKKRLLDNVETSMNKVMATKLAWKTKLAMKEDELADAKGRQRDLQSQLSILRATSSADGSSELRSVSARAVSAEKRVNTLANQLAALQDQVAEQERKHSDATSKWEARVAEFEKRLKAANERVKAEKQGGKERALQLEGTVKNLQEQLRQTNVRNERISGFLSAAKVTARTDPDAL